MAESIAVIICTWNRSVSLRTTLQSLQEQAAPPGVEVEVAVVDNNSSDDTAAVVAGLAGGWRLGQLRYAFEPRQGKQFALNTGIDATSAEVLAFTDDDILFPPGWIGAISALFANPRVELAGGRTLLVWPATGAPGWYADDMQAILGAADLGDKPLLPAPPGYSPAGANLIARRSLFERAGKYSESYFRHMDYEFGLRCARMGFGVAYDPSMVVLAPIDPNMLTKRYFRRWSFKAGILARNEDTPGVRIVLGVPRWVFGRLAADLLGYPLDFLFRPAAPTFARELRIWRAAGTIASRWYAWLWPAKYPQWVERYSQKKKNLY